MSNLELKEQFLSYLEDKCPSINEISKRRGTIEIGICCVIFTDSGDGVKESDFGLGLYWFPCGVSILKYCHCLEGGNFEEYVIWPGMEKGLNLMVKEFYRDVL